MPEFVITLNTPGEYSSTQVANYRDSPALLVTI